MSPELPYLPDSSIRYALALNPQEARTPACPEASVWYEVAARITRPDAATRLADHATNCAHCAPLLKAAADALDVHVPGLAPAAPPRRIGPLAIVAAGIVVAMCLGNWAWPRYELRHAQSLTAQGEAVDRPNEFRQSGAPYAPARFTRAGREADQVPPPLLEAADALSHAPQSPDTLLLKARIAIDSRDVGKSVEEIREAMQRLGKTPKLYNDLGVALASRWLAKPNDGDLKAAIEAFRQANSLPEGRFNLALALSHLNGPGAPCPTLGDPDPRWQTDLNSHLGCK